MPPPALTTAVYYHPLPTALPSLESAGFCSRDILVCFLAALDTLRCTTILSVRFLLPTSLGDGLDLATNTYMTVCSSAQRCLVFPRAGA